VIALLQIAYSVGVNEISKLVNIW